MREKKRYLKEGIVLLVFWAFMLCLFQVDAFAMNAVREKADFTIYRYDGEVSTPSQYGEEFLILAYGRTTCPNTKAMLEKAKELGEEGYSVKGVLMDIDSGSGQLQSFAAEHPELVAAHHDGYSREMWSLLRQMGENGTNITLPFLMVLDQSREIIAWSTGNDTEGLEDIIRKNAAKLPPGDSQGGTGKRYRITYHLNGGVQNPANPDFYCAGDTIVLKDPTREGYTFKGWMVDGLPGSSMAAIYPSFHEDFSLTAQWEKIKGSTPPADKPSIEEPSINKPPAETPDTEKPEEPVVKLSKTKARLSVGQSARLRLNGASGRITWKSSASSVAFVSKSGTVKGKKAGKATVTASFNGKSYRCAVTVVPAKQKIAYVKSTKAGSVSLKWKKVKAVKGYQIRYSTDRKFRKNVKTITISKYKTYKKTISRLKKGKTYYFRVRSYSLWKGKKYYGDYSGTAKVRVKR